MTTLAWTLVHFLWQGALIGAAALVVLRTTGLAASARDATGIVALAAMLAAPLMTFAVLASTPQPTNRAGVVATVPLLPATAVTTTTAAARAESSATTGTAAARSSSIDRYLPFVFAVWMSGVALLSLRLSIRWWMARRLAHRARPLSVADIESMARRLAGRLAVDRVVRLLESTDLAVPVVVGWMKPVVILPAAALAGMPPAHLEALLAHELAHVRRHDYLVNLLQSIVETTLFYHPAVWLVSREVRVAREHCCDDIAVGVCDRLEYVTALTRLATMAAHPPMALAATDGPLVSRVRRLLGPVTDQPQASSGWAIAVVGAMLVTAVPVTFAVGRGQEPATTVVSPRTIEAAQVPVEERTPVASTVPVVPTGVTPEARTVQTVPVETTVGETRARTAQETVTTTQEAAVMKERREAEARQLREFLLALERDLEKLRKQQSEVEGQRVTRDSDARIDLLRSDLVMAQATLGETRRKYEVGMVPVEDVRANEAQITKLQKELAATERQREFDVMAFKLQTDAAAKMAEYDRMKEQYEVAVRQSEYPELLPKKIASQRAGAMAQEVVITANGQTPLRLTPAPQPYTSGGPAVYTHAAAATATESQDGRVISGFKFLAWREGDGARVMVLALVPRIGEKNVFTSDPKLTELIDFATYLVPVGQTQTVPGGTGRGDITITVK